MQLFEAVKKAKSINDEQGLVSAKISKSIYGGYTITTEPIELTIIRNSLSMLVAKNRDFISNTRVKYGR